MSTADDVPEAARVNRPTPARRRDAVWLSLGATLTGAYVMLAVALAHAGSPIPPWVHVLAAQVAIGVTIAWIERRRRRLLEDLRATVRRLTAQPQAPQQAYLDGYLDAARERLAGRDATVVELRRHTSA